MLGPRDDDCVTQNGSTMMIEDDRRLPTNFINFLEFFYHQEGRARGRA
jgi:hypothetical protein